MDSIGDAKESSKELMPNMGATGAGTLLSPTGGSIISCSKLMSSGDDTKTEKLVNFAGGVKTSFQDMMTCVENKGAESTADFIEPLPRKGKKNDTGDVKISGKEVISQVEDKGAATLKNSGVDANILCNNIASDSEILSEDNKKKERI